MSAQVGLQKTVLVEVYILYIFTAYKCPAILCLLATDLESLCGGPVQKYYVLQCIAIHAYAQIKIKLRLNSPTHHNNF